MLIDSTDVDRYYTLEFSILDSILNSDLVKRFYVAESFIESIPEWNKSIHLIFVNHERKHFFRSNTTRLQESIFVAPDLGTDGGVGGVVGVEVEHPRTFLDFFIHGK